MRKFVLTGTLAVLMFGLASCWSTETKPEKQANVKSASTESKSATAATATGESANSKALQLMASARQKEKDGKFSDAIAIFEQIEREFPKLNDPSEATAFNDNSESNSAYEPTFGQEAHDALIPLRCKLKRPKDQGFGSPTELLEHIKAAFMSNDVSKIAELASCDFFVGLAESDVGAYVDPYKVAPILASQLKGADWSKVKAGGSGPQAFQVVTATGDTIDLLAKVVEERGFGNFYWGWSAAGGNEERAKEWGNAYH